MATLRSRVQARLADLRQHRAALAQRRSEELSRVDTVIAQLEAVSAMAPETLNTVEPILDDTVLPKE